MRVRPLGQKGLLEEGIAPHAVFLPGEPYGQRSLAGYSPLGRKESDRLKQLSMHKWSITFKTCESLYCTPVAYVVLVFFQLKKCYIKETI